MTQWLSVEAPEGNAHILPALKKIKWGLQVKLLTISENVGKLKKEREKKKDFRNNLNPLDTSQDVNTIYCGNYGNIITEWK